MESVITVADSNTVKKESESKSDSGTADLKLSKNEPAEMAAIVSTTLHSVQDSPEWSQAEALQLRNKILEVVEELRYRRSLDKDNSAQIKRLMAQNHELERKYDELSLKQSTLLESQDEKVLSVKKQFQGEVKHLAEEKSRYAMIVESNEQGTKFLKDEIRILQLSKYHLEMKLKEMDQKLHVLTRSKDSSLSQLTEVEKKCQQFGEDFNKLTQLQNRLELNVQAATQLNRKLSFINDHHTCIQASYVKEIASLKAEFLKAKVELSSKPQNETMKQNEWEDKVKCLEQKISFKEEMIKDLDRQLSQTTKEKTETVKSLEDAHQLLQRHVECSEKNSSGAEMYRQKYESLTTEVELLGNEIEQKVSELNMEKASHEEEKKNWEKQKNDLTQQVHFLEAQYKTLKEQHTQLEELNSTWAKRNVELTVQVEDLKELVKKEMQENEDKETQTIEEWTDLQTMQTDMETETESVDGNQTVIGNTHAKDENESEAVESEVKKCLAELINACRH